MALALAAISLALLGLRLFAATRVGFGDSEALYACWAMHPQPAYLDHPGLTGLVMGLFASPGDAPTPETTHLFTALLATTVPWIAVLAARGAGASWKDACGAGLVMAVVPETAVGLFALTPDSLLAIAWLGALGLGSAGLRAQPNSARSACALLAAGLMAGIAFSSKVTGALLFLALAAAYLSAGARKHSRAVWPWGGLVAGAIIAAPIILFEARSGGPMLGHRLIDTQTGAGLSVRNVAATLGGQLLYVSPLLAVLAVPLGVDLVRRRMSSPETALLFWAFVIPGTTLLALSLWSAVAEPHWLAPALVALPIYWAKRPLFSTRLRKASVATALALSLGAHAWVLIPALGSSPRYDIARELYGWPKALAAVREVNASILGDRVVVGPHWIVCAQLHAALGPSVPVGCATPVRDDFDDWLPRDEWRRTETILFVSDDRFDVDVTQLFPDRVVTRRERIMVASGRAAGRVFSIQLLSKRGTAASPRARPLG
jgi:hypothetical protein